MSSESRPSVLAAKLVNKITTKYQSYLKLINENSKVLRNAKVKEEHIENLKVKAAEVATAELQYFSLGRGFTSECGDKNNKKMLLLNEVRCEIEHYKRVLTDLGQEPMINNTSYSELEKQQDHIDTKLRTLVLLYDSLQREIGGLRKNSERKRSAQQINLIQSIETLEQALESATSKSYTSDWNPKVINPLKNIAGQLKNQYSKDIAEILKKQYSSYLSLKKTNNYDANAELKKLNQLAAENLSRKAENDKKKLKELERQLIAEKKAALNIEVKDSDYFQPFENSKFTKIDDFLNLCQTIEASNKETKEPLEFTQYCNAIINKMTGFIDSCLEYFEKTLEFRSRTTAEYLVLSYLNNNIITLNTYREKLIEKAGMKEEQSNHSDNNLTIKLEQQKQKYSEIINNAASNHKVDPLSWLDKNMKDNEAWQDVYKNYFSELHKYAKKQQLVHQEHKDTKKGNLAKEKLDAVNGALSNMINAVTDFSGETFTRSLKSNLDQNLTESLKKTTKKQFIDENGSKTQTYKTLSKHQDELTRNILKWIAYITGVGFLIRYSLAKANVKNCLNPNTQGAQIAKQTLTRAKSLSR